MATKLEAYVRIYYKNNTPPPINQTNLNKIEEGIEINRKALMELMNGERTVPPFSLRNGQLCVTYKK